MTIDRYPWNKLAELSHAHKFSEFCDELSVMYEHAPSPDWSNYVDWKKKGDSDRDEVLVNFADDGPLVGEHREKVTIVAEVKDFYRKPRPFKDRYDQLFKTLPPHVGFVTVGHPKDNDAVSRQWNKGIKRLELKEKDANRLSSGLNSRYHFAELKDPKAGEGSDQVINMLVVSGSKAATYDFSVGTLVLLIFELRHIQLSEETDAFLALLHDAKFY